MQPKGRVIRKVEGGRIQELLPDGNWTDAHPKTTARPPQISTPMITPKPIEEVMPVRPATWTYGITTCSQRVDSGLLSRTIDSLAVAGFDKPHLFIDGRKHMDGESNWRGLNQTLRFPAVRTAGNWVLSLQELLIREPVCQRYALFQDDLISVKGLRAYLDSCKFPDKGYWNLYTFPQNQQALGNKKGWAPAIARGLSAIGLVFNREGVMRLLSSYDLVSRPTNLSRGWRNIDGGVYEAMKRAGFQEFVHHPSLLMHVGDGQSTIGNAPHAKAISFPGTDFDASTLIGVLDGTVIPFANPLKPEPCVESPKPPQVGLGDQVEKALSVVGVTKERVEKWLGRPCGCRERQEKLNSLGGWVKRVMSGKTDQAKEFLAKLIGDESGN